MVNLCTAVLTPIGPTQFFLFEGVFLWCQVSGSGSGHDFKTEVEMHQQRFELLVGVAVSDKLRLAGGDLFVKTDRTHHRLNKVGSVDGDAQIGVVRLNAFDIGQGGVAQFDDEFLAVVWGRKVDLKLFACGLFAV